MTHEPANARGLAGTPRIGTRQVSRVAIGGASWSLGRHQDAGNAIATIHAAIDTGITTIDTARAYTTLDHESHNEWIIARALSAHPDGDSVFVATKGGHFRRGTDDFPVDASPAALRRDCELSLKTLRRSCIDLYQLHRCDGPLVNLAESVQTLAQLRVEGKIRFVGLCNVTVEQVRLASTITTIDTVQNRYSPLARDDEVLSHCADRGITYLAYSPLGGNRAARLGLDAPRFAQVGAARGLTPQQTAIAWLLSLSDALIPIVGAGRPASALAAAASARCELTRDELAALSDL
jgi:aryl-alcohol dehydrogenase-like predicted oxidoreductase